jgi:asparagine synthase (glutamine-hydrolysing)
MYIRELIASGKFTAAIRAIRLKGLNNAGTVGVLKELLKVKLFYPLVKNIKRIIGKPLYPWMSGAGKAIIKDKLVNFEAKNIRTLSIQQVVYSSIPYQLHSEDRNSMLFAIESRLPFLDHRLVEYITSLPADFKINEGYTKYILRKALPELPEPIRWRKDKLGFAAPDKEWVKENAVMIRNELEDAIKQTPFFTGELLNRFDRFVQGSLGYEPIYFRAMTLNRFCRLFNMQVE